MDVMALIEGMQQKGDLDWFLIFCAFLVGAGKGGVPGVHTGAVALFTYTGLAATDFKRAVATNVATNITCDAVVLSRKWRVVDIKLVIWLLIPLGIGMTAGKYLMDIMSTDAVRLFVGAMLLAVCAWNQYKEGLDKAKAKAAKDGEEPEPQQTLPSWMLWLLMVIGGIASVIANLMLPIMQLVMMSLGVKCKDSFIATPLAITFVSNVFKIGIHWDAGRYGASFDDPRRHVPMLLMTIAAIGVPFADPVVKRIPKKLFVQLTAVLLAGVGLMQVYSGSACFL